MNSLQRVLFASALAALLAASPAHAINLNVSCDGAKTTATGKMFAAVLKCIHKGYGTSFDIPACEATAKAKLIRSFEVADLKYGLGCAQTGNGQTIAADVLTQAAAIWNTI